MANIKDINSQWFFKGGGEMGKLMRNTDWEKTPLGHPDHWSIFLQSHVSTLLQNKVGMYIAWGKEYTQLYNDAYRPILGTHKHPQALGISTKITFTEIWHIIESMFQEVMEGGAVGFPDFMLPLERNGYVERCYFDFSYSPIYEQAGQVGGVLVNVIETTEKKRSFKSLLERENQLEFTIEAARLGTWDLNPVTNKFVGNKRLKTWFGLPNDAEIELATALSRIIDSDRDRVISEIQYSLTPESNGLYDTEYTIEDPQKSIYRNVRAIGKADFDEENKPTRFSGILLDISEHVNSRKKLEKLRERFENMANSIPNLAWIAKADGYIYWYNTTWYEYTGTTPEQMEGWGWQSVHDQDKLPEVLKEWTSCIATGKNFEIIFPLKGADGLFRPFLTRAVPLKEGDEKIIGWVGTNTDITKQKEAELLKENFLSIASHELRTPITTIKAYAQLLGQTLEQKNDIESVEMTKKIEKQVKKMTTLIEDLLDISKIQKNILVLNTRSFSVNALLGEIIDDMQSIYKSHTIQKNLSADELQLTTDADKLYQVVSNLITNGIKYSPGQNSIIVKSSLADNGVKISVQDFGIGISSDEQVNIFDQFYRASSGGPTYPGLGLGLYITSELVKKMKGKIWLSSNIGKGSIFYIWLPSL